MGGHIVMKIELICEGCGEKFYRYESALSKQKLLLAESDEKLKLYQQDILLQKKYLLHKKIP